MFVPGKPFQPSLIFVDKVSLPRMEHLKYASLGEAPALPENIRVGWKGFLGINTPPYYEHSSITDTKRFIILSPSQKLWHSW